MFSSSKIEELNQFLKTQVSKKICPGFDRHSVFLTHQGDVYTRGLNNNGQLGLGDTETRYRHRGHLMPIRVPGLENIIDIETGTHHTLCLNNEGHVYAFGNNTSGQLGLGDNKDKTSPCLIESLKDCVIISMKTNACVSYFLDTEGNVYSCGGFNNSASLGLGKDQPNKLTLPKKIPNLPAIKEIIPCGDHVFFLTHAGKVYGCGNNHEGQLGMEDDKSRYEATKLNLPSVKQIDGLWDSSFFLTKDGEVFISGKLAKEKLLIGTTDAKPYSLIKLNIDPIVKLQVGSQLIFISENNDAFIYFMRQEFCYLESTESRGEIADFLDYRLTIPDEIQKTLSYVYFHAPLFKAEKDSILEKECHIRVDNMDGDWCLKNSLIFKHGIDPDSASHFAPYIKTVSQQTDKNKISGTVPSLKFLSALSFINQHKKIPKFSEVQENMTEDMNISDGFKRLEIKK